MGNLNLPLKGEESHLVSGHCCSIVVVCMQQANQQLVDWCSTCAASLPGHQSTKLRRVPQF